MILTLLKHKWKESVRSPALSQQLLQFILLAFLFLYFASSLFFLGVFLGKLLREEFPNQNIYSIVGGGIIYYFLFDLLFRLLVQKFPVLNVKKYLPLAIKNSTLIHYLLLVSFTSFFNFLPFFAIIPFVLVNFHEMTELGVLGPFILFFIGGVVFNNLFAFFLDRFSRNNSTYAYVFIALLSLLITLDIFGYLSIKPILDQLFSFLISNPIYSAIPFLGAGVMYWTNYQFLKNNLYIEDLVTDEVIQAKDFDFGFSGRFGEAGKLMDLEMKLIWRNKRSRVMLYFSSVMLIYPLMFLGSNSMEMPWFEMFIGIAVTGMFSLNYGQLLLSWNSTHFDLLATRKIEIADIFIAKYYLIVISCVVLYVLSLLYGLISLRLMWIMSIAFLYNIGCSVFMYIFLAAHNSKRVDPSKSPFMNYEGIGLSQFLIGFPILFGPALFSWPFAYFGYPFIGEVVIGLVGLLGFVFHKPIIALATRYFKSNRYKIMAAFRKKS